MDAVLDSGKELIQVQHATVRFAGDSGDGTQLVGGQFADIASMTGSAICSFPDFPSNIRAPAGTLGGVSGYQLSFGDHRVTTPGDAPFVLVAMNAAALKVCLPELQKGGIIIANEDAFSPANLKKAEYDTNPLKDGSLDDYRLIPVPMGRLNDEATATTGMAKSQRERCKYFFALGMTLWLYDRPLQLVRRHRRRGRGDALEAVAGTSADRGCEKMGLAPSENNENPRRSAVAKVPIPIFSQPHSGWLWQLTSLLGIWAVIWYLTSRLAAELRRRKRELAAANRRLLELVFETAACIAAYVKRISG